MRCKPAGPRALAGRMLPREEYLGHLEKGKNIKRDNERLEVGLGRSAIIAQEPLSAV
jgi:hypothetical protein